MADLGKYRSLETAKAQPQNQGKEMEGLHPTLAYILPTLHLGQSTWV